jgi:hypothetical protein
MTEAPRRRVFLSSSNTTETMMELARKRPEYKHQLNRYAYDLDCAVEAYVLDPREDRLQVMVRELVYCRRMYKAVTGNDLYAC